jgi:hypothetical protein
MPGAIAINAGDRIGPFAHGRHLDCWHWRSWPLPFQLIVAPSVALQKALAHL